ncbi:16S rRNA (guanine(527)-N(7))-methyltransferase RsmG [Rhabdothermincola salaria]|uniref:16S rRNA (guanine(527)-N(7))-methyltransferase RsmG n=1 Tax=Rhabdothermincola salaria TaxID=2903142 RepID=UPI001E329C2C|nr:RsmG family class I SAM-dependent methyltransferase [Rhabdothermincola salaria]MCD9624452.1 class I SAM-dependent methyltransferase [Rhabdothermincola salaria]
MPDVSVALRQALERARRLGVLGPTPIDEHLRHAHHFLDALGSGAGTLLDLGSGAGLPGLVIADMRPELTITLLDAQDKRVALLRQAVTAMGCGERVQVLHGRAEALAHEVDLRGTFDTVTARLFGPPAVVAECGAPFLAPQGRLLVSEPPGSGDRWPPEGLDRVGLVRDPRSSSQLTVLRSVQPCPTELPRRVGIPAKRPLF